MKIVRHVRPITSVGILWSWDLEINAERRFIKVFSCGALRAAAGKKFKYSSNLVFRTL